MLIASGSYRLNGANVNQDTKYHDCTRVVLNSSKKSNSNNKMFCKTFEKKY